MRDDFTQATKETLAKRVGCRCSNPGCCKLTSGPHEEDAKSVNIGVAAHITAAASGVGAKRYDSNLSTEERKAITNGIWLCQNCGKLVDSDEQKYSVELLLNWKRDAEDRAALEVESGHQSVADSSSLVFRNYLKSLVGEPQKWWLDEINDLTWVEFPLSSTTKEKRKEPNEQPKSTPPQLVLDAIKAYEQEKILIVGSPGAGKSTLLETICKQAAARAIEDPQAPIPVLVELRDYKAGEGFRGLILQNLQSHDQCLDEGHFKKLLQEGRLLLLVDGLNENPEAKSELKTFCRNVPLIATGRQDSDGWEIERKLELQPLSTEQVKCFFELRLPDADRAQVQALGNRVKDFGQTPLMVWMLYSIFRANKDVPETRGEAYRSFTTLYAERAKDGIDLSDSRSLLGKLAFEMMRSKKVDDPTDFSLKILEVDAPNVLGSEVTLKRMLNHLLKQQGKAGNREISFCHQSLQEYYAAEYLLEQVKNLDNDSLQQEYLNYLKWTEPVALMLGLIKNDEDLAVRVVELALDVDLMLGARLAGEINPQLSINEFNVWIRSKRRVDREEESIHELFSSYSEQLETHPHNSKYDDFNHCKNTLLDINSSYEERETTIVMLSKFYENSDAADFLNLFLEEPGFNEGLKALALRSLAILNFTVPYESVQKLLVDAQEFTTRATIIEAIGIMKCAKSVPQLIDFILGEEEEETVMSAVISSLLKIKEDESFSYVEDYLKELDLRFGEMDDYHKFQAYNRFLGYVLLDLEEEPELVHSRLIPHLPKMCSEKNLLQAFQDVGYGNSCHKEKWVSVAEMLAKIGHDPATKVIISSLGASDESFGEAIEAIERISLKQALPKLFHHRDSIFENLKISDIQPTWREFIDLHNVIKKIQINCKLYNYEIQQAKRRKADRASLGGGGGDPSSSSTTIVYGDYIAGDKIGRDKILGNKTEAPNATEVKIFEQVENYYESPPPTQDPSS